MWDWVRAAEAHRARGTSFAIVTVVRTEGSTPREIGAKMVVTAAEFSGTIGGGHLEELALGDARRCLRDGGTEIFRYPLGPRAGQCCGGVVEVMVETVRSGPRLYLFGAGHVGRAICQVLEDTPFQIALVDERPEWVHAKEIPSSVARHDEPWDAFLAAAPWDAARTFVAVMTHRHDLDEEIVQHALRKPARYVGLIGSKTKWARIRSRLREKGVTEQELDRVECPIGIPIGGKSPKEVAISVAARLLQQHHGSHHGDESAEESGG